MKKILVLLISCFLLLFNQQVAWSIEEPPEVHFMVKKFEIIGNNPLSDDKTQSVLENYLGDHYGLEGLQDASDSLEQSLRDGGYAFYRVTLIPQGLEDGIIKFQITEFRIDRIFVEGNQYFDEPNILSNAPTLSIGSTPNTQVLSRALNMANNLPSKTVKLKFEESETGGAIDAKLTVEDSDPAFYFLTLNNTGVGDSGDYRLTGGYDQSNVFNKDHNLSVSYTLSPDAISAVNQFGLTYDIPDYESGSAYSFLFSDSNVSSGEAAGQDISGKGTVTSFFYKKTFLQKRQYKQKIGVGLDIKSFESEQSTSVTQVLSRPITILYNGSITTARHNFDFNIAYLKNITGGSNNEDADYASFICPVIITQQCGSADWATIKYGLSYSYISSSNLIVNLRFSGQETSDKLISGEQFGLGGKNSIRGFDERIILGEKGYQANLDLYFPTFSAYKIRPLIFYDIGHVEVFDIGLGLQPDKDPAAFGAGLRWSHKNEITASVDIGYVTKGAQGSIELIEKGDTRLHLNVFYKY